MRQRDFVKEAESVLTRNLRPGTADGDINVIDDQMIIGRSVLVGLLSEITRLRAVAGAVSTNMPDFSEIKKGINNGPSV
jgi:hypothetical protein